MKRALIGIHAVMMLLTFGWAASDPAPRCEDFFYEGERIVWRDVPCGSFKSALYAIPSATVWPLYWSWTISDAVRGGSSHD